MRVRKTEGPRPNLSPPAVGPSTSPAIIIVLSPRERPSPAECRYSGVDRLQVEEEEGLPCSERPMPPKVETLRLARLAYWVRRILEREARDKTVPVFSSLGLVLSVYQLIREWCLNTGAA